MINNRFEAFKIQVMISRIGSDTTIYRNSDNGYGGTTGQSNPVVSLKAIYHEFFSHIRENVSQGSITRSANSVSHKDSYLLCLSQDTDLIRQGDWCIIGSVKYFVHSVSDLNGWGIISEISLRPQDDGNNNQY